MEIFTTYGLDYIVRWAHFLAGITWIGLLYYFNFVQTEYFKEAERCSSRRRHQDAGAKSIVVVQMGCDVYVPDGCAAAGLSPSDNFF